MRRLEEGTASTPNGHANTQYFDDKTGPSLNPTSHKPNSKLEGIKRPDVSDANTQTGPSNTLLGEIDNHEESPHPGSFSGAPQASEDNNDTQTLQISFSEENRIVIMEDLVSLLLTEETLKRMSGVIVAERTIKQYQNRYKKVKREASIGESYIKNAEAQLENPALPEEYKEQTRNTLQQRRYSIIKDVQTRSEMEKELGIQRCNLEYSRG